ncbi:MAG: TPR end-of-group domain-containing protein [Gammaproteobacteria bacterium]
MSFLDSLTKKSRLNNCIKQTAQARKSEGAKAEQLYQSVYQGYAEVVSDDPLRAEALYYWGHALLHQAKTKTGDEAASLYRDAIVKFAFCMTIDPDYLAAAIDGGVAYMDLARLLGVSLDDTLYRQAQKEFEKANAIQAGSASYNLACIYALRGEDDACLKALESSKNKGSLPDADDILNDPDLNGVKQQSWFAAFMETLSKTQASDSAGSEGSVNESVRPDPKSYYKKSSAQNRTPAKDTAVSAGETGEGRSSPD